MAKRFTDTEKWRDPWFCGLTSEERGFWSFILDTCNLAGIWQVNWPLVKFYMPTFEFKENTFEGRIQKLNDQKWFIPKFIKFQYGELQTSNRLHQRVIYELEKEGVSKGLKYPSEGVKDKDMDKDMVLNKEKGRGGGEGATFNFEALWGQYPKKDGRKEAERHFKASVKTQEDWQSINKALGNYLTHVRGKESQFIKNGSTWFNNWKDWVDFKGDGDGKRQGSYGDKFFDKKSEQKPSEGKVGEVPILFR